MITVVTYYPIQDYPARLSECKTVLEKVLSMREPVADALETKLICEWDIEIQENWMDSFQKANQMFDIFGNLTG